MINEKYYYWALKDGSPLFGGFSGDDYNKIRSMYEKAKRCHGEDIILMEETKRQMDISTSTTSVNVDPVVNKNKYYGDSNCE